MTSPLKSRMHLRALNEALARMMISNRNAGAVAPVMRAGRAKKLSVTSPTRKSRARKNRPDQKSRHLKSRGPQNLSPEAGVTQTTGNHAAHPNAMMIRAWHLSAWASMCPLSCKGKWKSLIFPRTTKFKNLTMRNG